MELCQGQGKLCFIQPQLGVQVEPLYVELATITLETQQDAVLLAAFVQQDRASQLPKRALTVQRTDT